MASGVSIQVQGLDSLKKKFGAIPKTVTARLDAEMETIAREYVNRAVAAVPIDMGLLKQGITANKVGELEYEVVSAASYSAYIEFGTKTKVEIPAELRQYAAQFKGPGKGTLDDFFKALVGWVTRKAIAARWAKKGRFNTTTRKRWGVSEASRINENEKIAYIIMIRILQKGIAARPFFFPHLPWARTELMKRSEKVVANALK